MAGASVAQALDQAHEISKTVFAGTPPAVHLGRVRLRRLRARVEEALRRPRLVEAPGDTPHLLVKGLELKTRDQCDFVRERLEAVVRDVLATRDLSRAKRTLQRAVVGVEACPLQDLILWRRYRGEGAYKTNRHDLVGPVKELDARGNRTAAKDRVGYAVEGPGLETLSAHARRDARGRSRAPRRSHVLHQEEAAAAAVAHPRRLRANAFAWYQATPKPALRVRLPAPDARPTGKITYFYPSRHCIHCAASSPPSRRSATLAARPDFLAVEHFIRERGLERRRWELERSLAVAGLGPRRCPPGSTSPSRCRSRTTEPSNIAASSTPSRTTTGAGWRRSSTSSAARSGGGTTARVRAKAAALLGCTCAVVLFGLLVDGMAYAALVMLPFSILNPVSNRVLGKNPSVTPEREVDLRVAERTTCGARGPIGQRIERTRVYCPDLRSAGNSACLSPGPGQSVSVKCGPRPRFWYDKGQFKGILR